MAKKGKKAKKSEIENSILELISDNNQEDSGQGGMNALLSLLSALMQNQSSTASSALSSAYKDMLTGSRHDEDIGMTEVMRLMAPAWGVNMKNVVAAEYAKTLDFLTQNNQIAWNGINQSNIANNAVVNEFAARLASSGQNFNQLMAQPFLFTEMAPATQDTPGEGSDGGTGKKGKKKKKK